MERTPPPEPAPPVSDATPPPAPDAPHAAPFAPPQPSLFAVLGQGLVMLGVAIPALCVLAALTFVVTLIGGPFLAVLFAFTMLLGLVLVGTSIHRLKRDRSATLLSYLDVAARLNLPMPEFMDALHRGEGKAVGKRSRRMAEHLYYGGGLGEALYRYAPELPAEQAAVVWQGEQAGRLREAIGRALGNTRRAARDTRATNSDAALQYGLIVMVMLLGVMGAMSLLIIPKFEEIFIDFDTPMPAITRMTFQWGETFAPILMLGSFLALTAIVGWSAFGLLSDTQRLTGPVRRLLEPLWWRVPVLSRSAKARAMADTCFTIEQAMRAGRPLPDAVEDACHPAVSGVMHRKLRRFAARLRDGRALPDAARDARLPALFVGMLGTASQASDPADTFAYLCRYYTHRLSAAEVFLKATALPVTTLLAAVAVAWFVFALLIPLVVLIEAAVEGTGLNG